MKDRYAFPDIVGEEIELKPKAMSKYLNYWERFKNLVRRINLKDVSGSLHFRSEPSWQAFKETFEAGVHIFEGNNERICESGNVNVCGIRMDVYGPYLENPNYVPPTPQELAEKESKRHRRDFMNHNVMDAFWELIVKGLVEVDNNLMKTALEERGSGNWDYMLAKAKIHYSEVEK